MIGFVLPESVYVWFLGEKYAESKYYVVMYLLGYGVNLPYLILVNYFFFYGKNNLISVISFLSAVLYFLILFFFKFFIFYFFQIHLPLRQRIHEDFLRRIR